ncbi:thylakoid lumenal 17.4 kDa protein, chloroplastic isoform X2 [Capsella rubella]|uniref:thylakoid lumenal 17.4 kDa protein, chloroplastic isoform X2 n=1 Tax=Capsella rubella TaxID=81985 RepID=UPI000CD576D0|nr:thylakoid lumenal 17.4 kDa protein, chloroplastic isoform X2 [Capsella rubella]
MASLPVQFTRNNLSSPCFSVKLRREPRSLVTTVHCSAGENRGENGIKKSLLSIKELGCIACAALCACTITMASPVIAANQRLPPLSTEPDRCEKAFVALMVGAKFDGADMTEVVMSKAYAVEASFKGVNFSNAVIDRVNFGKSNLKGAVFRNTVLSGSTFEEANLEDVVFEDTIIGYIDLQKICRNETINEEGRLVLGCR